MAMQPRTTISKQSVSHTLIVVAVLAVTLGSGICLAWRASTYFVNSEAALAEADNTRTGTILDAANGSCRSFDNDTGRTSPADPSCNDAMRKSDAKRRGTAGRINAISKSFNSNR
jgi:hypothetical protein